jgi:hypothetical protein
MKALLKGAFVEYPTSILRPLVNVVLFQFNPEELSRSIEIPPRPAGAAAREVNQAGEIPVERISLTAQFTADDRVLDKTLSIAVGIGPQLAALEKLVRPQGPLSDLLAKGIDKLGDKIRGDKNKVTQPIPRESYPRVLFIWGTSRLLPVTIDQMQIIEQQYDALLNPIRASVNLTITVIVPDRCSDDVIAKGASIFSESAKEVMAAANLVNTVDQVKDLIHF